MTDKERLMKFIDNIVPNDFKCGHLSLTFADDGSALLIIGNKEDAYDTDRITQDERERIGNKEDAYNTDRITQDERERIVSWLGKFCRHIDNFDDISLNEYENTEFFKEKMYQQFGWEKTLS